MNWQIILDPAFSGRVCLVLAHSLWQLALVAALAWAIGRLGRLSVERSYVLHVGALFVGLAALPVTYALVDVDAPAAESAGVLAATGDLAVVPPPVFLPGAIPPPVGGTSPSASAEYQPAVAVPAAPIPAAVAVEELSSWLRIAPWMVVLYALGVAMMFMRLIRGIGHARRLGAAARPVDDTVLVDRLNQLARRWSIRVAPALGWVEGIAVPKVIGLVRPTILLPMSAITCLSSDDLEMILAHELAHVRRHDMWVNLLQRAAEVALFFNPGLWYLSRRISTLREYCCDELACRAAAGAQMEPKTRYASALVRVAELSRLSNRQRVSVQALAADGRSPSDLRRRIARLMGEPLDEPIRLSRGSLVAMALAAALLLAAPTAWQSAAEPAAERAVDKTEDTVEEAVRDESPPPQSGHVASAVEKALEEAERIEMSIVVARHVLLLEGKEIVTWEELEKKIAALPDPSKAYPHFYTTRGTYEAGAEEKAKEEMYRLHSKYKLEGHSEGSLWPRADLRYDRIKTAEDLVPDPSLRIEGRVVDGKGVPAAGAEVLLVTPVDESIPYKSVHIELVEGRVRNRLEQVMTLSDEDGRFAVYPPKDSPFYIVVLHPKRGFALVRSEQFAKEREVRLLAWSELVTKLADEPGEQQESSIRTTVRAEGAYPEIIFNQYWVDLKRPRPSDAFRYTHVPPILATTISRDFPEEQGGSIGMPGATVDLLPGEARELGLGPLSDQQREQLNWLRKQSRSRSEGKSDDVTPAEPAADAHVQ